MSKVGLLSKAVVGRNIALPAAPADRASNDLVSAVPIHSTSFPPKLSNPQQWNVS